MTHYAAALALLLVGSAAQFAWKYVDPAMQGDVWNACEALLVLLLLAMAAAAYRSTAVWLVCALLGAWQGLTAACSLAWLARPWPVMPGQAQCSALLDVPLDLLSCWLAAVLAVRLHKDDEGDQDDAARS